VFPSPSRGTAGLTIGLAREKRVPSNGTRTVPPRQAPAIRAETMAARRRVRNEASILSVLLCSHDRWRAAPWLAKCGRIPVCNVAGGIGSRGNLLFWAGGRGYPSILNGVAGETRSLQQ